MTDFGNTAKWRTKNQMSAWIRLHNNKMHDRNELDDITNVEYDTIVTLYGGIIEFRSMLLPKNTGEESEKAKGKKTAALEEMTYHGCLLQGILLCLKWY